MESTKADKEFYRISSALTDELSAILLEKVRWPQGLVCPKCAGSRVSKFAARNRNGDPRRLYQCAECKYQYSVLAGTLFQNSHVPLWKWLGAIWLMSDSTGRPSVRTMERILSLPYKTVWTMARRIKEEKAEGARWIGRAPDNKELDTEGFGSTGAPRRLSGWVGAVEILSLEARLERILGSTVGSDKLRIAVAKTIRK